MDNVRNTLSVLILLFSQLFYVSHAHAAACSSNMAPRAVIGPERNASLGEEVIFDAGGSSDPDGDTLYYSWDFDSSNGISTDQTGVRTSMRWVRAGDYTVTLTVRDACTAANATALMHIADRISLSVRPTIERVAPGDSFGLTVQYANFTNHAVEDMVLTLDYDERFLDPTDLAGGAVAGGAVIYRQRFLYQSSSEQRTFWFRTKQALPPGTTRLIARARLAGKETATIETDEVAVSVEAAVNLVGSIVIDGESFRPGQTALVKVGYHNRGNTTAEGAALSFHFDPNVWEPLQTSNGDTGERGSITWQIGSAGPEQKSTEDVRLRVRETAALGRTDTWIRLTAANASPYEQHVLSNIGGSTLSSNPLTVTLTATDADEFRVRSHRTSRGDYVTFTVILTNNSSEEVKNTLVNLDYQDNVFAIAELREAVDAGGSLTWEIDRIEPKGVRTLTARLRVLPDAPLANPAVSTVTVTGDEIAVTRESVTSYFNGSNGGAVRASAADAPRTGGSPLLVTLALSMFAGVVTFLKYRGAIS